MKKVLALIIAMAVVLSMAIIPTAAYSDDNYVMNAYFDDDDIYSDWNKGWVDPSDSATWSEESRTADGSGSVRLESLTLNMHFSQVVTLDPGTYTYSCWMKVSENYQCSQAGATGVYMSISATAGDWPNRIGMALDSNENLSTEWQYYEGTVEIPETGDYVVALCMWGTKAPEEGTSMVWFDEVYLGQQGSPYAPGFVRPNDPADGYFMIDGEKWYLISDDLLEESGLGNPTVMNESGISVESGTWLGHEDWNGNQGWDGFMDGTGNGLGVSTRELVETTLSDGSTGYALRFANDDEKNSGSQNAIENLVDICELEELCHYAAIATVKVTIPGEKISHPAIFSWNATDITESGITGNPNGNVTILENDSQWHTVTTKVYTPDGSERDFGGDQYGTFLEIGVAENWIVPGTEILIENVKIYEVSQTEPTPTPTPEPTPEATPEPTNAPEATAEPANPTEPPKDEPEKKGCGSVVISAAVVTAITLMGAAIVLKKKED